LANQLAAAGKPIDDQDFITFLIGELHPTFTTFIASYNFACRDKDLSLDDFQYELLSFETLLEASNTIQNHNFAFAAKTSNYPKRKLATIPKKFQQASASTQARGTSKLQSHCDRVALYDRPQCQICDKYGHIALHCF